MRGLVTILFSFLILGCLSSNAQYEVMVSTNYPPYNFEDEQGEMTGFNIELLKAIVKLYDVDIKISKADWETANRMLENHEIDALAGAHYPGSPRSDGYFYTRSVSQTSHCFLFNFNHHGKVSAEQVRTTAQPVIALWDNDVLKHYVLSINPNAKFLFVTDYQQLLRALESDEVLAAFAQKTTTIYFAKQRGMHNIRAANEEVLERNMGFKVANQSPELAKILNNGLEVLMANGEYRQIYNAWIKPYYQPDYNWQQFLKYLVGAAIAAVVIIIVLMLFNLALKSKVQAKTRELQRQLIANNQITRELEKQKLRAEESDRMKSAFLANMSHEIRTPMNGILGFTELLKTFSYSEEEEKHFIDIIQQSGKRMLATINNIIDISKIEAGVETLHLGEVNVEQIVDELYQFFMPEAQQKGLTLRVEKDLGETAPILYTDGHKLNSILTNLVKNALKFTPSGQITIGCSVDVKEARFYVSDTGIGINKQKQATVFNYFMQADSGKTAPMEGSGLGLSISKQYTEMLEGDIRLESEPGKGTTFYVHIPNRQKTGPAEPCAPEMEIAGEQQTPSNLKVIVGEDDKISFHILQYILKAVSTEILHAKNGLEAVELAKAHPDTDLIMMDSKMPKLNGLDAVRRIREFNKTVVIIAQTAFTQSGYKEETLQAGCNGYIEKPIKKEKLIALIAQCVHKKHTPIEAIEASEYR